ncbi:MAG: hypothetical protein JOS17DRAFT_820535 [Linnemannia elongata]|nr:MAG: hypothetical protein JOS17DRAFT_820535 [Linnemannia elongata]
MDMNMNMNNKKIHKSTRPVSCWWTLCFGVCVLNAVLDACFQLVLSGWPLSKDSCVGAGTSGRKDGRVYPMKQGNKH